MLRHFAIQTLLHVKDRDSYSVMRQVNKAKVNLESKRSRARGKQPHSHSSADSCFSRCTAKSKNSASCDTKLKNRGSPVWNIRVPTSVMQLLWLVIALAPSSVGRVDNLAPDVRNNVLSETWVLEDPAAKRAQKRAERSFWLFGLFPYSLLFLLLLLLLWLPPRVKALCYLYSSLQRAHISVSLQHSNIIAKPRRSKQGSHKQKRDHGVHSHYSRDVQSEPMGHGL